MPNIAFERPVFTLAAILAPFVIIFGRRFFKPVFSLSLSLGPPGGAVFRAPFSAGFLGILCKTAYCTGAFLLLFAASGPLFVTPSVIWLDRGADILFVLDCSPSMAALDMAGKRRFDTAVNLVREFSAGRPADAIGLAIVGNDAALLLPPTTDRATLFNRLENLKIGEMGDGTALGMGLSIAAFHAASSTAPRKAVVLVTDGENNAGAIHPETAAAALDANGISLYIIAVGSTGEVPIDYIDPYTNVRRTGSFDSRYNPDVIAKIAEAGGGIFIPAPSAEAFNSAFSLVNEAEITVSRSGVRETKTAFHVPLIIAGMILVSIGILCKILVLGAFL